MNGLGRDVTEGSTDQKAYNFGKKILIIENDLLQAYILERMLSVLGCTVVGTSRTGEEAIDIALKLKPDVLMVDISLMGEIDGITAVAKIQQKIKTPVIYVTGNEEKFFLERAKRTEFVDFILKPLTMEMLIKALIKVE